MSLSPEHFTSVRGWHSGHPPSLPVPISLDAAALPWYAVLSLARMGAAYALSLVFSLVYGYYAARNRRAEQVMIPLLDVLQSVPILSFLPVALLSLSVLLTTAVASELAAVVLIFASQVWNLTFSVYQSTRTVPGELREAAAVFRFGAWFRLKYLELPFAANGLVWNSVMSWAGGWFFLRAAEMFTVGSYPSTAAQAGDLTQSAVEIIELARDDVGRNESKCFGRNA